MSRQGPHERRLIHRAGEGSGTADAREVVVVFECVTATLRKLYIDGVFIPLDATGTARVLAVPGVHVLRWSGQARPHAVVRVEIAEPPEARWRLTPPGRASAEGMIDGCHDFAVGLGWP